MDKLTGKTAKVANSPLVSGLIKAADVGSGLITGPYGAVGLSAAAAVMEKMQGWVSERNERRLLEFHSRLLNRPDPINLETGEDAASVVENADFHALLAACVRDIEEEKTGAYAELTHSIARGHVKQQWRRHFILSLSDLSWEYLDYLRRVYVVTKNNLMAEGSGSLKAEDFLTGYEAGTVQHLAVVSLNAKSFVDGVRLSQLGELFVEACSSPEELSPEPYGYQRWSNHCCEVMDLGSDFGSSTSMRIQNLIRAQRIKLGAGTTRAVLQMPLGHLRIGVTCFLVITRGGALTPDEVARLAEHVDNKKVFHVNVTDQGLGHPEPLFPKHYEVSSFGDPQWEEIVRAFARYVLNS